MSDFYDLHKKARESIEYSSKGAAKSSGNNSSFKGELDVLFGRITGQNKEYPMDSCKMRLCLDIMEEMGLIERKFDGKAEEITLNPQSQKINMEDSKLLEKLRRGNI